MKTSKQLTESLIRKIKISKMVDIEFFGVEKEIIDFINSKLDDLIIFKTPKHPDSTFYMSPSGDYIFELYTCNVSIYKHLWIDSGFFGNLTYYHKFERSELGLILQQAVSKAINKKVPIATDSTYERRMLIEMLYKQHIKIQENELSTQAEDK